MIKLPFSYFDHPLTSRVNVFTRNKPNPQTKLNKDAEQRDLKLNHQSRAAQYQAPRERNQTKLNTDAELI